ncbi:unnamed protein product [Amaranthus hypochondriacus]
MAGKISFSPLILALLLISLSCIEVRSSRIDKVEVVPEMGQKQVFNLCSPMPYCNLPECRIRCGLDAKNSHCSGNHVCCCQS